MAAARPVFGRTLTVILLPEATDVAESDVLISKSVPVVRVAERLVSVPVPVLVMVKACAVCVP